MARRDNAVTGAAGVHYVAYVLNMMGYAVQLTAVGFPGVDLIATNPKTGSTVSIQVKTSRDAWQKRKNDSDSHWRWRGFKKADTLQKQKYLYALVALQEEGEMEQLTDIFIVPSSVVVKTITAPNSGWSPGWFGFQDSKCGDWRGERGLRLIRKQLGDLPQD